MIDAVCRRARLSPRHVTAFIPVSRTTASQWLNGRHAPGRMASTMTDVFCREVRAAIKARKLPLPRRMAPADELNLLRTLLTDHRP